MKKEKTNGKRKKGLSQETFRNKSVGMEFLMTEHRSVMMETM